MSLWPWLMLFGFKLAILYNMIDWVFVLCHFLYHENQVYWGKLECLDTLNKVLCLRLINSHFHSAAKRLTRLVFPAPGLPITIKHVGLEWMNRNSVWKKDINALLRYSVVSFWFFQFHLSGFEICKQKSVSGT